MIEPIVVTGMGCISAAGNNASEFKKNIFSTLSNDTIREISLFKADENTNYIAAEVKDYISEHHFSKNELKLLDRFAQFALISAQEAIIDAELDFTTLNPQRISVVHGSSIGGQQTIETAYAQLFEQGKTRTHPFTVPKLLPSAATSQISMKFGIKGPAFSTSSACSSSGHAIAMAALMLRSNLIDVAIVGGAEACITKGNFMAWDGLRVLSTDTCRPFSLDRSGLVIGEGAGTLILERETHARERGAKIYAKLSGIGMSSDAHNAVQPLSEGAEQAMKAALDDAKLTSSDIDYVNAHGSGTIQNDKTESLAINTVFAGAVNAPLVSSTKSIHGHMLGAGAVVEVIASILAIQNQTIPPTANFTQRDPLCPINLVSNQPVQAKIKRILSNSFAFGGLNVSLIFEAM
ncbi:beta-ketoacyl-[acyl-carrier-protein] synthase family protein [Colwellia sp. E150_009]